MAHSVHTPPASRTPQSIRTPSPAPWPSRRTLKFCSLPDAPAPVAGAHSKFRAPSTKAAESKLRQLALSRSRADIPRLRYVGCSKSPPLLLRFSAFLRRTTASNAFELRDNVARAAHGSSLCGTCTARRAPQVPRSFHLPTSFVQPSSCPAGSRSQAPLRVLSPRLTQCCTSGSRRLAHGLPQSRGRVALHARCIFLAAQRGSPCVCTYGYNTCERASERHPETQKETRVRSRNMVKSCSWRWHGHGYDPVWAHDHVHLPVHLAGRHLPGLEDLLAQRQRDCRRACVRVRAGVK